MKRHKRHTVPVLLLLWGLWALNACAPKIYNLAPDFERRKPHTIAVLPVFNETNDLDAPHVFEPLIYEYLRGRGYRVIAPRETKALLASKNIHEAGQVHTLTYPELGKLLKANALLLCTVTDWSSIYLVVYASVSVEAKFELRDAAGGDLLWKASWKSSYRRAGWDKDSLERNIIHAALSSYEPRARAVVRTALQTLPYGPYFTGRRARGCIPVY